MFKIEKKWKGLKLGFLDAYIIFVSGAYIIWRILVLLKIVILK